MDEFVIEDLMGFSFLGWGKCELLISHLDVRPLIHSPKVKSSKELVKVTTELRFQNYLNTFIELEGKVRSASPEEYDFWWKNIDHWLKRINAEIKKKFNFPEESITKWYANNNILVSSKYIVPQMRAALSTISQTFRSEAAKLKTNIGPTKQAHPEIDMSLAERFIACLEDVLHQDTRMPTVSSILDKMVLYAKARVQFSPIQNTEFISIELAADIIRKQMMETFIKKPLSYKHQGNYKSRAHKRQRTRRIALKHESVDC